MVFKPSFKYLKNEKDNFIKVVLKLEYLFYQNIYIYIFVSSFFIFVYAFRHKKFKNSSKRKKDKIIKL